MADSAEAYSGLLGKVRIVVGAEDPVDAEVSGFSMDPEVDTIEVNTTGSRAKKRIKGHTDNTGSFDFYIWKPRNPFSVLMGLSPGAAENPVLEIDMGPGLTATGEAIIKKLSIKSATKDAITGSATFEASGDWTYPTVIV